jgi:hypothetical protein
MKKWLLVAQFPACLEAFWNVAVQSAPAGPEIVIS